MCGAVHGGQAERKEKAVPGREQTSRLKEGGQSQKPVSRETRSMHRPPASSSPQQWARSVPRDGARAGGACQSRCSLLPAKRAQFQPLCAVFALDSMGIVCFGILHDIHFSDG